MNLKSKIFGTLAASAIALSMSAGMVSANDSAQGTVTLAKGVCTIEITQDSVDFGIWTYNGEKYVHTGGNNAANLNFDLEAGRPGGTCDLNVTFSGLKNGDVTIAPSNFNASVSGVGGPTSLAPWSDALMDAGVPGNNQTPREGTATLTLREIPSGVDYQPNVYTGTIGVTISNTD